MTKPTATACSTTRSACANVVKSVGLQRTEKALDAAAKAAPVALPSSGGSVMQASATAGTIGTIGSLAEDALPAAVELGASAIAAPIVAFVGTLLHSSSTASNDTIYDADHLYGPNVFNKPPKDAKDKYGAKAPGKPGAEEGFKDPKTGEQWGRADNGEFGWIDADGTVWVPTG